MARTVAGTIKVCPLDGEPALFTFEYPGIEYVCLVCDWGGGIFGTGEAAATDELAARRDELIAEYEQRRGLTAPDQDQPHPTCSGCGVVATGRLDHSGKPAHWYCRTVDDVTEYACSRACIQDGTVMPW